MVTELAVKTPLNRLRGDAGRCWEISRVFRHRQNADQRLACIEDLSKGIWTIPRRPISEPWKASKRYMWIQRRLLITDHKRSWMIINDQKGIHCKPTVAHLWVAGTNVSPIVELRGFGFDFTRWIQGPAKWNCPFGPFLGGIAEHNFPQVTSIHFGVILSHTVLFFCAATPTLATMLPRCIAVVWWQDVAHDLQHFLCEICDQALP